MTFGKILKIVDFYFQICVNTVHTVFSYLLYYLLHSTCVPLFTSNREHKKCIDELRQIVIINQGKVLTGYQVFQLFYKKKVDNIRYITKYI